MNKIEELIAKYCPDGVEYNLLVKVANVQYGCPFEANLFTEDNNYMPLIRIRDIIPAKASTYYSGEYSDEYVVKRGDILVGMDGNFNLSKWDDRDGLLNQRVCRIFTKNSKKVIDGYLYHLLGPIFKQIENEIKGGTVKHLSAAKINKIEIPIPPIEVQEEIVRILDTMENLILHLEKQLEVRKKQYEYFLGYYFDGKVNRYGELVKLEECIEQNIGGGTPSKSHSEYWNGDIPWASVKDLAKTSFFLDDTQDYITEKGLQNSSTHIIKANSIIIATRISPGKMVINRKDVAINQDLRGLYLKPILDNHYLTYYFQTKSIMGTGTTVKGISISVLNDIMIPVPSIIYQQSIVRKLDSMRMLQENLERMIVLRKKQYEYYREKLLSFKRL